MSLIRYSIILASTVMIACTASAQYQYDDMPETETNLCYDPDEATFVDCDELNKREEEQEEKDNSITIIPLECPDGCATIDGTCWCKHDGPQVLDLIQLKDTLKEIRDRIKSIEDMLVE